MRIKLLSILSIFLAVSANADKPKEVFPLDPIEQSKIQETVQNIKNAVESENPTELMKYISKNSGLSCTDTDYSYKEVEGFLNNKNSHLYLSLFNELGFRKICGSEYSKEYPATSVKEFLLSANTLLMVTKLDEDWVQVTITSKQKDKFPEWWYLHKEGESWKVGAGSFVVGDCACGG